jgi:succinate dehydrogenase / fumarate reductase cytochrome b subunit
MVQEYDRLRPVRDLLMTTHAGPEFKGPVDGQPVGEKIDISNSVTAPGRTENEVEDPNVAVGLGLGIIYDRENGAHSDPNGFAAAQVKRGLSRSQPRPHSPTIPIYRPQLTSVLSILNRITGILLSASAVFLVVLLLAAASGPQAYGVVRGAIASWVGQGVLFGVTLAFFLHLCGGIRHLLWDSVLGFELRSIYISGWFVVAASVVLTVAAWILSLLLKG